MNETKSTPLYLRGTEIDKEFPDDIGKDNFIIAINTYSRSLWRNGVCDMLVLVRYVKEWR